MDEEIAQLRGLALKDLRARWQSMTGREAPPHLPRHLLFTMVAYRLQADALGDLDAMTLRLLKKVGSSKSNAEIAPLTDAFDQQRRDLLPGTVVTRALAQAAVAKVPRDPAATVCSTSPSSPQQG